MATMTYYRDQSHMDCRPASCAWRAIGYGFNVEGLCQNKFCPAHNSMIVVNVGFGEYDLARVVLQEKYYCPICRRKIQPRKYGLRHCRWWYVDHYSTDSYPLNQIHDTYELFDLNGDYIIIEVMPLPKTIHTILPEATDNCCPICLLDLDTNENVIELTCSHTFHRSCIRDWLESNQLMATKCPLCRKDIVESDSLLSS